VDQIDELLARAEEQQRLITEAQQSLERTELVGRSRNGVVTAKLRGSGQLVEVSIDPRQLARYDAKALGVLVVEAVNDAMARLSQATRDAFAPFLAEVQ
jgi:nucleoid-associated protein EbfC